MRVGLNVDVPEHTEPFYRNFRVEFFFSAISYTFHRLLIIPHSVVCKNMPLLAAVINPDIGVWGSDLYSFVRDNYLGTGFPLSGFHLRYASSPR